MSTRTPMARPLGRVIRLSRLLQILALPLVASPALAWVYPEHRDIAVLAVEGLDPERRAVFDELWREARMGNDQRLCQAGADVAQGVEPRCIDWAAMPAIAGDHSCSSKEMLQTVLQSDWILDVADVSAQLKVGLAEIAAEAPSDDEDEEETGLVADLRRQTASRAARARLLNVLRTADTRLQSADPEYATRAGSNNAHFLLSRPSVDTGVQEYAELTLRPGVEVSATGVYANYHASALQKATRLANEQLTPDQRRVLARSILADEAFGLHFLEDMYAAGHVAGTWGDASQRKGTHDYYNEAGLEVFTWEGDSYILTGDAHMRPEDAERAAGAVRVSLEQVLDTATGRPRKQNLPYTSRAPDGPDALDVCKTMVFELRPEGLRRTPELMQMLAEVLLPTAVPGLGPGLGSMPRFRSEVGPFLGLVGSIDGRYISGGFDSSQNSGGAMGGVDLSVRGGLGLEGVIGDSGDGLIYLQVGFRADSPSSNKASDSELAQEGGSISAAIPSRFGLATRIRMPFYLIPGDLLFLSPLYFISPEKYTAMAVTAANGGLIPWQLGWATQVGRFQFVLGRELGVNFYGFGIGGDDRLLVPAAQSGDRPRLVDYHSVALNIPVAEYRPYRSFSTDQSTTLLLQLFTGVDIPYSSSVVAPDGAPEPDLGPIWNLGVRFVFDWRHYY